MEEYLTNIGKITEIDPQLFIDRLAEGDPVPLFILVALFGVLACLYSLLYQFRVSRWPSVWGVLNEAGVKTLGAKELIKSEQGYYNKVSYSYEVGDKNYTGHRLSAMVVASSHNMKFLLNKQLEGISEGARSGGGKKVKVYYNPRNPGKSYLINGSKTQVIFTLVMGILALLALDVVLGKY